MLLFIIFARARAGRESSRKEEKRTPVSERRALRRGAPAVERALRPQPVLDDGQERLFHPRRRNVLGERRRLTSDTISISEKTPPQGLERPESKRKALWSESHNATQRREIERSSKGALVSRDTTIVQSLDTQDRRVGGFADARADGRVVARRVPAALRKQRSLREAPRRIEKPRVDDVAARETRGPQWQRPRKARRLLHWRELARRLRLGAECARPRVGVPRDRLRATFFSTRERHEPHRAKHNILCSRAGERVAAGQRLSLEHHHLKHPARVQHLGAAQAREGSPDHLPHCLQGSACCFNSESHGPDNTTHAVTILFSNFQHCLPPTLLAWVLPSWPRELLATNHLERAMFFIAE